MFRGDQDANPRDPYAPPETKVSNAVPSTDGSSATAERLYTVALIGVSAFQGSFMASAWFVGKKLAAVAQPEKMARSLALGFVATLAIGGINLLFAFGIIAILIVAMAVLFPQNMRLG